MGNMNSIDLRYLYLCLVSEWIIPCVTALIVLSTKLKSLIDDLILRWVKDNLVDIRT
jgi:hypothetical protein